MSAPFLPGMDFGGGGLFHDPADTSKTVVSLNITPAPSGIAHYDESLFLQTMKTGTVVSRRLNPIMPIENYRNMTDDDLRDVWAYLRSVAPVTHRVSNTDAAAKCPVCGQTHGLGDLNKAPEGK
jgi:hypothetical protein